MADATSTLRGLGPEPGDALILLPDRNSPGRSDWSGAFRPEALRFARLHAVPPGQIVQIDTSQPRPRRLEQALAAIERSAPISVLAVFSHGWKGGLGVGPYSQDVKALVRALELRARGDLVVALYACSTGEGSEDAPGAPGGEGGFADALRDALIAGGFGAAHVDAHTCEGHTTRNPFVRRFDASTATGGAWLVDPHDGELFPRWRQRLHDSADDLRFRYPLMSADEVRAELRR